MKKELQQKLFDRFPNIFRDRNKPPQETAMCWGIACGDGWFHLIWSLCEDLEKVAPETVAFQVKQKLGGLRFYVKKSSHEARRCLDIAEVNSFKICEWCGRAGGPEGSKGWIRTLCLECRKKEQVGWRPWHETNFFWFRVGKFFRDLFVWRGQNEDQV